MIDLRQVLLFIGLVLTLIAVGVALAMTINGHGPNLIELSALAIAVLIASRESA